MQQLADLLPLHILMEESIGVVATAPLTYEMVGWSAEYNLAEGTLESDSDVLEGGVPYEYADSVYNSLRTTETWERDSF